MKPASAIVIGLSWVLLLTGCTIFGSTEPSRFYLLTPLNHLDAGAEASDVSIRIVAVELPKHLDGPEIVTRLEGNQLLRAEYDRWGEPLSDSFANTLAKNLSLLIPTDRISRFPWEGPGPVDFHVSVAVLRFDSANGQAVLEARWNVTTSDLRDIVATRRSELTRSVNGEEYASIARAMSATVGDLSRLIADAIRAQVGK